MANLALTCTKCGNCRRWRIFNADLVPAHTGVSLSIPTATLQCVECETEYPAVVRTVINDSLTEVLHEA